MAPMTLRSNQVSIAMPTITGTTIATIDTMIRMTRGMSFQSSTIVAYSAAMAGAAGFTNASVHFAIVGETRLIGSVM